MDDNSVFAVLRRKDFTFGSEISQQFSVLDGHLDINVVERATKCVAYNGVQTIKSHARFRRNCNRVRIAAGNHVHHCGVFDLIALVDDQQRVFFFDAKLCQYFINCLDLVKDRRVAAVGHVQQQVGLACFLKRRFETGDQTVRQVADEPDRVAQQHRAPTG